MHYLNNKALRVFTTSSVDCRKHKGINDIICVLMWEQPYVTKSNVAQRTIRPEVEWLRIFGLTSGFQPKPNFLCRNAMHYGLLPSIRPKQYSLAFRPFNTYTHLHTTGTSLAHN
jgi:hypothetical protein